MTVNNSQFTILSQSPLYRTAWRRIRRRPFQYLLLILGVALGVAMTVSIDLAAGSAGRAFELSTDAVAGKATHRIVGGAAGLDEDVYRRLVVNGGGNNCQLAVGNCQWLTAAPVVEAYILAAGLGGQPMRLVGVDPFAEPPFRDYFGGENADLAGLAAFLTEPNSVILAAPVAAKYGVALGDAMEVAVDGRDVTVRVVGLLQPENGVDRQALAGLIFADIATAQEILGMAGRLSRIDLIADDAQLDRLTAVLPGGVHIEPARAQSNTLRQMTAAFELNLRALSLLALVVGMFLIYNTVTFSVVQRRPLFGVLRALGVTGGQLFRLILAETAVLGLIGSLLGLALGVILGRGMVRLVTQTINDFYFTVSVQSVAVPPLSLARGLAVGVLAAVFAAAMPAWEAMKTAPQTTLRRSSLESRARRLLPWLVPAWAVLFGAGALLLWLKGVSLAVTFAGLFAVLLSFALLTPPVTAVLMRWLAPVGGRLLGPLGRMAPRDIARSLSRTSVAIAALMTAVSVIVGVSIMINSFRGTVAQWLGDTLQADVYLSPPGVNASALTGTLPPAAAAAALDFPGVAGGVTARHTAVNLPDLGRTVELVAVDGDVSRGSRAYVWLSGSRAAIFERLLAGEGVFLDEPLFLKEGMPTPPPPLTLMTPDGPRAFPVLAVFTNYASDRGTVMMGQALYRDLWRDEGVSSMGLFLQPGVPAAEVVDGLGAELGDGRAAVVIQSNRDLRADALAIFDRTFAITAALRLLAVVVAFIGVLSALMSLQLERARELGVLRATGMTLRQLWGLTLLETGLMGGTAGLLALPTGFILAWVLIYVINVRSFGWTLRMALQPGDFLQSFVVSLLAALLAGIYPALRLGRMVVATALRSE